MRAAGRQEQCKARRRARQQTQHEERLMAAHLHDVDDQREEVDPPLGGDSTRLGLEPRSHRQQLPLVSCGSSACWKSMFC